ncbi:hypothetical protein [Micromonospora humida]|uniref:hypothetical protein n=1 Tax=Micromonospora humida TaxID=2809018 RepID=UPI00342D48AE
MFAKGIIGRIVALTALVSGSVVITSATGAQAAPEPLCLSNSAANRATAGDGGAKALDRTLVALRRSGKSQAEIDRTLFAEEGLRLVSTPTPRTATPMSSESIVSVPAPSIYRDTCTSKYYAIATWKFSSLTSLKSDGGCTTTCNVGGYDVFAISFSRNVSSVSGYSSTAWGASSTFPSFSLTMVSGGTDGVAARAQDRLCGGSGCGALDYNMYNGQIVYSINTPGCGELQAFSEYTHTWSTAQITGIGVGIDSISVSWNPTDKGWDKGSQPSNVVRPC